MGPYTLWARGGGVFPRLNASSSRKENRNLWSKKRRPCFSFEIPLFRCVDKRPDPIARWPIYKDSFKGQWDKKKQIEDKRKQKQGLRSVLFLTPLQGQEKKKKGRKRRKMGEKEKHRVMVAISSRLRCYLLSTQKKYKGI